MELLNKINLTKYQREIIKSLLKYKKLDAMQISKYSKVPPNKVYQTIKDLVDKNIVFQSNSKPKEYSLLNFDRYLKNKIEEKQKEVIELENELDLFLETYKQPVQSEDFWILNDLSSLLSQIESVYERLEIGSKSLMETWVARYSTLKLTKKAIENGKEIKFIGIVNKENKDVVKKWLQVGVRIKNFNIENKAGFAIFDEKYIKISVQGDKLKSIWSQNESLALILENYFDILWDKSEEITLENIDKII